MGASESKGYTVQDNESQLPDGTLYQLIITREPVPDDFRAPEGESGQAFAAGVSQRTNCDSFAELTLVLKSVQTAEQSLRQRIAHVLAGDTLADLLATIAALSDAPDEALDGFDPEQWEPGQDDAGHMIATHVPCGAVLGVAEAFLGDHQDSCPAKVSEPAGAKA